MIGIYKITKKSNGKSYIGQFNNIERRIREHQYRQGLPVEAVIQKYGKDAFTYEVIEECPLAALDEREQYWINYYNTYKEGYNCNEGGGQFAGENNGRARLTEKDVEYIRECYNNHRRRREVYEEFKNKISFNSFAHVWDGSSWSHIKPEVYTEENLDYYKRHATDGENSITAVLTNEEVLMYRTRYITETAAQMYPEVSDRISFQTFQTILWGNSYKNIPVYSKRLKRWINK